VSRIASVGPRKCPSTKKWGKGKGARQNKEKTKLTRNDQKKEAASTKLTSGGKEVKEKRWKTG